MQGLGWLEVGADTFLRFLPESFYKENGMRFVTVIPVPDFGVVTLEENPSGSSGVIELLLNNGVIGRFSGNTFTVSKSRVNAAGLVLTMTDGSRREVIL